MFIVTGATGQLGRLVVNHLLTHISAELIGVSVRDPEQAADIAAKGVRVRRGDYTNTDSLRRAFEGVERILMISSNAIITGGDTLAQHRTAINVAKEMGATRILYTSHMSSAVNSHFSPGQNHAATEQMLAESGVPWTSLRHGYYAESALVMNEEGFKSGVMAAPEDGKVAWTSRNDLAAVDAALLAGIEEINGPTPPLTSSETLDLADLAAVASGILGRPIMREVLSDEQMRAKMREFGTPEVASKFIMGYYMAARNGELSVTDSTLERLIGRKPQTMRDFMEQNLRS